MSSNQHVNLSRGLRRACKEGQLGVVRAHLAAGADANGGWTKNSAPLPLPSPLHNAACRGHEAVCRLLLEHGADPNIAADRCAPPLNNACSDEDVRRACAMATLLLDFGADIEATDDRGRTPLIRACRRIELTTTSNVELVTLLLDRGANILKGDPHTPLWHAVDNGKLQVVNLLLQRGATADNGFDPSHPQKNSGRLDTWGMNPAFVTPLYNRLRSSSPLARQTPPLARLLLAHGASFDREHRVFDRRSRDPSRVVRRDTPLSFVRSISPAMGGIMRELNELFDAYLTHYWKLRVRLRLFGSLSEHLLDLHVAPYLIGDGILSKKRS